MSDTPQTDHHVENYDWDSIHGKSSSYDSLRSFARNMERERDQARRIAEHLHFLFKPLEKKAGVTLDAIPWSNVKVEGGEE